MLKEGGLGPPGLTVRFGDLVLDFLELTVTRRGRTVGLPHRDLVILYHLGTSDVPVSSARLTGLLFGADDAVLRMRTHQALYRLRKSLPGLIVTAGVGPGRGGRARFTLRVTTEEVA